MITINIVCVGNLKERFWKEAVEEYSKRISAFAKLNIFEVKEATYGTSNKDILNARKEEAERLSKHKEGYTIALEILGKSFDSESFADHISKITLQGNSTISFFIGGSYGLDQDFVKTLDEKLSFSNFTFPHQLMRVILLEQVYRAFTILNGKTYHK